MIPPIIPSVIWGIDLLCVGVSTIQTDRTHHMLPASLLQPKGGFPLTGGCYKVEPEGFLWVVKSKSRVTSKSGSRVCVC